MDEQKLRLLAARIKSLRKQLEDESYPAALTAQAIGCCAEYVDLIAKFFPEQAYDIELLAQDIKVEYNKAEKRRDALKCAFFFPCANAEDFSLSADLVRQGVYARAFMFLLTPFEQEAELTLSQYAFTEKAELRNFDSVKLLELNPQDAERIYSVFASEYFNSGIRHVVHIKNVAALKSDVQKLTVLAKMIDFFANDCKDKVETVVSNTDSSFDAASAFENLIDWKKAYNVNYAAQTLSMPSFNFFRENLDLFKKSFCGESLTSEEVKDVVMRYCFPLGFSGLFSIIGKSYSSWDETVAFIKSLCRGKKTVFEQFAANLSNINGLLDKWSWNYKLSAKANSRFNENRQRPNAYISYEYDGDFYEFDKTKVEGIMNDESKSFYARLGKVLMYCLTFSSYDDDSYFSADAEERKKRWDLAADALSAMLFIKRPTLEFDLTESDVENGQNVNGGEVIRLKKRCLSDSREQYEKHYVLSPLCEKKNCSKCTRKAQCAFGDQTDAFLHELYHSVQFTSISDDAKREFYESVMGIESHRIRTWRENRLDGRYVTAELNPLYKFLKEDCLTDEQVINAFYYQYSNQVFEADARIFAAEVLRAYYSEYTEIKNSDIV